MFGDVHNTRTLRPHVVFDRPFQPFLGLTVDLSVVSVKKRLSASAFSDVAALSVA